MKKISLFLMLLVAGLSFQACNNNSTTETNSAEAPKDSSDNNMSVEVNEYDSKFMIKAADGGIMEVRAGKLAMEKTQSQTVKDFAERMVNDHTKAADELIILAANRNVLLPSFLDKAKLDHLAEMGKKTGANFDKHYMDMMVNDHNKTVSMFEDAANNIKDAAIKDWAARTLVTIKEHQQAAKALKGKM